MAEQRDPTLAFQAPPKTTLRTAPEHAPFIMVFAPELVARLRFHNLELIQQYPEVDLTGGDRHPIVAAVSRVSSAVSLAAVYPVSHGAEERTHVLEKFLFPRRSMLG